MTEKGCLSLRIRGITLYLTLIEETFLSHGSLKKSFICIYSKLEAVCHRGLWWADVRLKLERDGSLFAAHAVCG